MMSMCTSHTRSHAPTNSRPIATHRTGHSLSKFIARSRVLQVASPLAHQVSVERCFATTRSKANLPSALPRASNAWITASAAAAVAAFTLTPGIAAASALSAEAASAEVRQVAFEPQAPDASVLTAQGLVLLLTGAAAGYWWLVVVPSERAALGRSKRLGPLDSYLRELERPEAERERRLERWFYMDWLRQREERRQRRQQSAAGAAGAGARTGAPSAAPAQEDGVSPEADLDPYDRDAPYSDNLLRPSAETPMPRFLSLDNPIVATGALLLLAGLAAGLQRLAV